VVGVNYDFGPYQVGSKLVETEDNGKQLFLRRGVILLCFIHRLACIKDQLKALSLRCPSTAPNAKSLASHIISKGRLQSGATMIGEETSFFFSVSKAYK